MWAFVILSRRADLMGTMSVGFAIIEVFLDLGKAQVVDGNTGCSTIFWYNLAKVMDPIVAVSI